jgi:hypothetical protein
MLKSNSAFKTGKARAQAEVMATPEDNVRRFSPIHPQIIWRSKCCWIPVCGAEKE